MELKIHNVCAAIGAAETAFAAVLTGRFGRRGSTSGVRPPWLTIAMVGACTVATADPPVPAARRLINCKVIPTGAA